MESEYTLEDGSVIPGGRYRIARLLYQRPRLNLYLARRVSPQSATQGEDQEPLVAIRELVLTGLPDDVRTLIEAAAFREFYTPTVPVSPHQAMTDRLLTDNGLHYLIMQLWAKNSPDVPVTLEELLLDQPGWPPHLDTERALEWVAQLGRIAARLHRLGVILGDLNPATILLDRSNRAAYAPILLPVWPPAPHFWPPSATEPAASPLYRETFPIVERKVSGIFSAPEVFAGVWDERSDVYALGAILYLLLTRYAPMGARLRLDAAHMFRVRRDEVRREHRHGYGARRRSRRSQEVVVASRDGGEGLELIAPRLLRPEIPPALERIVLCALEMDPARRYASAFALVEQLEEMQRG
jgi:serine/threonine protein kinase